MARKGCGFSRGHSTEFFPCYLHGDSFFNELPDWIYITAVVIAATLFAAGHLPITAQTIGLSTPILIRCFILNGLGGIGFGYLYWKKGLAYSMYSHAATHIFMQVIFMPLLF